MIPRLHLVTDDAILRRPGFLAAAEGVLGKWGGSVALHVRGPRSPGGELFRLCLRLGEAAGESGSTLLVNDRADVALSLGLSGVHLGQRSVPPPVARKLLGPSALIGLSVHDRGELEAPGSTEADYFLGGSVYPTLSHPGRASGGPELVRALVEISAAPLLAIGGITPSRVGAAVAAGAYGVAVRGGVWDVTDPEEAVGVYLDELRRAAAPGGGR